MSKLRNPRYLIDIVKIKQLMQEKGFKTFDSAANASDMDKGQFWRIANGVDKVVRMDTLICICDAFEIVDVRELCIPNHQPMEKKGRYIRKTVNKYRPRIERTIPKEKIIIIPRPIDKPYKFD